MELRINKELLWDYDYRVDPSDENFVRLYISRVLTCGTKKDVEDVGIAVIKKYFTSLNLPDKIRRFWEWYFEHKDSH